MSSVIIPSEITASLNDYCWHVPSIDPVIIPNGWVLAKGQTVFRHGARTPAADRAEAFGMASTIAWDCETEGNNGANIFAPNSSSLKFRMIESSAQDIRRNYLNGTCELGQLVSRGYEQELANGKAIYAMYETNETVALHEKGELISLRSTDKDRTKASAMGVLEGFYSELRNTSNTACNDDQCDIIMLTMDYDHETMVPKFGKMCKEQDLLLEAHENEMEYIEMAAANQDVIDELDGLADGMDTGSIWPVGVLDMLKTHLCEDKADQLPPGLNTTQDLEANKDLVVEALVTTDEEENWKYAYDNGSLSKLVVGRLVTEITMKMIYGAIKSMGCVSAGIVNDACISSNAALEAAYPLYKPFLDEMEAGNGGTIDSGKDTLISLYSGHDTTVTPLIIALGGWDEVYSRYGTTVNVDTFAKCTSSGTFPNCETVSGGDDVDVAFRIVYNNKDVTGNVFGGACGSTSPCPIEIYLDSVADWAGYSITKDLCTEALPEENAVEGAVANAAVVLAALGIGIVL